MTRKLVIIRHGDEPYDDRVHSFAQINKFVPVTYHPARGDAIPAPDAEVAGTVILGGTQSAECEIDYPYLAEEIRWIEECMAAEIPILGICLGAQLIIRALGGRVGPLNGDLHEFGYYPIAPTEAGREFLPKPLFVTQAHHHTFTLPEGVELLATGANYANQAFRFGSRVYGLQFHPECTIEIFRRWQRSDWAPYGKPCVQPADEQTRLMLEHDDAQAQWLHDFLSRLFAGPGAGSR